MEKTREEDPKGDLLATLKGHIMEITHLDLRDNRTLISSSLDAELRQWDTMKETVDWIIKLPGPIRTFILNNTKDTVYAVCDM